MKRKLRFLNFFFCPELWGLIIIVLIFFNAIIKAQETPPPDEFPVGTQIGPESFVNIPAIREALDSSGLNTLYNRADEDRKTFLANYSLLAVNTQSKFEYISHYTTGFYSKWEAEENQTDSARVGIKHYDSQGNTFGQVAFWENAWCWSTEGLSAPACSLMYGPHYRQEKRYKRLYDMDITRWGRDTVQYVVRFNMALSNPQGVPSDEDVCKIKVVFRYKNLQDDKHYDAVFKSRVLKVSDFNSDSSFKDIYLHENPDSNWYQYPDSFVVPRNSDKIVNPSAGTLNYVDYESYTGIQYWVEWLRNDTKCNLYIDYVELYDNDGWNFYLEDPIGVSDSIKAYAQSFSDWDNIIYWAGVDEPYIIDTYMPVHIVDSLIRSYPVQAPPLTTPFNPTWTWDHKVNGEDQMVQYYNIAKPSKLNVSINPCYEDWPVIRAFDYEWMKFNFQRASALDPNFWYNAQTHGFLTQKNTDDWCVWRKPEPPELKSMVMLALAHGAKGIMFFWFESFLWVEDRGSCVGTYWEAIVDEEGNPLNLYYTIKDTLVPRLKGKLGKTLMELDYTGVFLPLRRYFSEPGVVNTNSTVTESYLTLTEYTGETPPPPINFHAGFFSRPSYPLDNCFMLDNLITTNEKTVKVTVHPPVSGYENYRFRNIEGIVDTTFKDSLTNLITYPAGEGYLYQVAPVTLYGGRLLYPESVGGGMVLNDDMIIENGATLTIYDNYIAEANITVKNGTILVGENGKIIFDAGKKLIIDGACTIGGLSNDKLHLVFSEPINDDPTGIMIKSGGSLTISNCTIEGAMIGIESQLNANYLNVQYVDFINCSDIAISIAGYGSSQILTPPTPSIKYCTITGSDNGVWASNLSQIIIRENNINGAEQGIYLSNVTTPAVIGNILNGNNQMPGIFLESCNGVVRGNRINNHTHGILIGNSASDIGGNIIEHNWNRGLYVGIGSLPNMHGKLVQDPEHPNLFYAVSGYNRIYENGGWEPEDDGSEIFINNANVILKGGCNQITDQRIPNAEAAPPLFNTQFLMNCSSFGYQIEVHAEGNFWDEHPIYRLEERFGDCIIYLNPVLSEPCPEPDGSGGRLPITALTGEVVDTLYAEERTIGTLTDIELQYTTAEGMFLTGDLIGALQIYEGIIAGNATVGEKYFAYQRKYEIGKLTNESPEFFNEMSNIFLALASSEGDTLAKKRLNQLSTLSTVGEQEYEVAINEFDGIIQQNPNTEEAVYAEIDALTAALLIEEADSTLHKGKLGKYLIKSSDDYNKRVYEILKKNFGNESEEREEELLPTEYTLYQNYPNPFNPTTTIKYDLPNTSEVSLIIYDILGRKVKELVNDKQQAGRYEVQFNASSLASGVYIYQLIAENPSTSSGQGFISAKKMILLK